MEAFQLLILAVWTGSKCTFTFERLHLTPFLRDVLNPISNCDQAAIHYSVHALMASGLNFSAKYEVDICTLGNRHEQTNEYKLHSASSDLPVKRALASLISSLDGEFFRVYFFLLLHGTQLQKKKCFHCTLRCVNSDALGMIRKTFYWHCKLIIRDCEKDTSIQSAE